MKAIRLLRRTAFAIGFVLSGACAAAQGNAAATDIPKSPVGDKTVPAGQVLVKASPDYQPIEPGWYHAKTAHFDVYTKDAKIGRKIADELIEVRSILEITWPAVLTIREIPITIVGCSGQNGFHEWSAQPPTDISSTLAGPAIHIIVNADVAEMLKAKGKSLEGKTCLVSGSGNVSQYTVEKLLDLGAKPITLSDSGGAIFDPDGIDREKLAWVMELKNARRGRIREYTDHFKKATFIPNDAALNHNPLWNIKADCAFPSATQNEIGETDAANLLKNGIKVIGEGANMPSTADATKMFLEAGILYGPAKAANAGGVATSGLEMSQNSMRLSWTREEVDKRLQGIMSSIHKTCFETRRNMAARGTS